VGYTFLGENMEYDVYLKMDSNDVHTLSYILEVEDNLLNMRKYENGVLRILVPADLLDELLNFLQNVKDYVKFELLDVRLNRGTI
jgi:predicted nucleotidyltransferase